MNRRLILISMAALAAMSCGAAVGTQRLYLSGTGSDDTKTWEFFCTKGQNSGKWSTIEVPSQWELQGYGDYTYGRFYLNKEAKPSDEEGLYKYTFTVPADWKGMDVDIVFEGSMTDTEVKINGKSAGPIHQGAFTEFSYDISNKLRYGQENTLEVKVSKESADASVNKAERRADWWLFGGIYRPVYLTAKPKIHIERVAIDAKADGTLTSTLFTQGAKKGHTVGIQLRSLSDGDLAPRHREPILRNGQSEVAKSASGPVLDIYTESPITFTTQWEGIKTWDPEHPNLYEVTYTLYDKAGQPIHEYKDKIGFRTIEFRERDGFYLNGTKLLVKGVNRHCFHPESGRAVNKTLSLEDAKLIKEMNMNAVRSHYAPDRHFLEVCDSIGLLYLDEFPGWHGSYNTEVGSKLLKEHVSRDINHPSVFLWSNGNEGGWNTDLDSSFDAYDPQKRLVVHPWSDFNGVDTHHYPAYQTGPGKLANGRKVFMPTEFLHSRYDKGAGSGLEDYWENYRRNPMFAGGFIWAFVDEAVKRTDKDGWLDSDGSNGCDGIVGPYREKEGSFYTIKDVWAPIQFAPFNVTPSFDGRMLVTNDYLFTNFDECSMKWRTYKVAGPVEGGKKTLMAEGDVKLPSIDPGETGRASLALPDNFLDADILEVEMYDPYGESVVVKTWPMKFADQYYAQNAVVSPAVGTPKAETTSDKVMLTNGGVSVTFDRNTGMIEKVEADGKTIPLTNGPIAVGMKAKVKDTSVRHNGEEAIFRVNYSGGLDSIVWRLGRDGRLAMDAVMLNRPDAKVDGEPAYEKKITDIGLTFSYPEEEVKGMAWLGQGPYRVWKNRLRGANFGSWHKDYNNTITGNSFEELIYPEFKGYHGSLYWATLEGNDTDLTVHSLSDGIYLRVFTPALPENVGKDDRMEKFPEGDISFLIDINAMRSFKPVSEHGPHSQPTSVRIKPGDDGVHMRLVFEL